MAVILPNFKEVNMLLSQPQAQLLATLMHCNKAQGFHLNMTFQHDYRVVIKDGTVHIIHDGEDEWYYSHTAFRRAYGVK